MVRDVILILATAIAASFLIKTFLVRTFYIPSASMEDTLHVNDRIIVNELVPRLVPVHRGDIVVFEDPGGWLPPVPQTETNLVAASVDSALTFVGLSQSDTSRYLVKRVIGLPGDHVTCCDSLGQLQVNGRSLKETYTTIPPGSVNAATRPFDVVVPEGSLWVMGDNRYNSRDSSLNQDLPGKGFVPVKNLVGKAVAITWPVARLAWID